MITYDAIVLGAGAMGSAAAYHLAKAGQRVLLLEQFEIDHQKGSSYGRSRIIRYAYDHPAYIPLLKAAYAMWSEIESESGEKLYTRTGGIDFGTPNQPTLQATINCLEQTGIPHEILNAIEAQKRYPQFRFDDDQIVLYQGDAGILEASKCVLTHIRLAEKHGATIRPNTTVTGIATTPESVTVKTDTDTFTAAKLVITAGSWSKSLLNQLGLDLPLIPERCQEIYFNTENSSEYEVGRFPTFIAHLQDYYGKMPYGIASHKDSGLKMAFHGGQSVPHPSQVNYTPDTDIVDHALAFSSRYIPDVTSLRSTRICLYTMSPDGHFLLDKHPEYPNIAIGGGCSGHSFKFATLIGSILSDLALNGTTEHDISLFNINRLL